MDWKDIPSLASLRAFDALARHGSLSAAARELNVTHAAVSQHLRALESDFAEPLARREGQGMVLTEAGHELAAALGEGFARIAEGVTRLRDRRVVRPVVVALTPSFAEAWLMPRIGAFWAAHPEIEVRLVPGITLTDLRRDGVDLAIRFGAGQWPGVQAEPLALSRFAVVAAPGYTKVRSLADLDKLTAHDWFFSTASSEQRVWGAAIGADFDKVGAREMANNGLVLSAVRAGLGLSIQAMALVQPDLAAGQLVSLYEGDAEGLGYYIVTRAEPLSPGARVFLSWLRRAARTDA
ncbi:LysR family transcriptional regulator [Pararhodobacter zhoushanensis]|uniref:LysR family transcriptional regulator n=1 Tax=Pararhodobacter zhoushanensis TaxID=2479545 RepID=A0ABT3GTN4_9RHOB|nr:LysR family transcriptional regulator [Pararhodobacter zhoushanensis]MCW1930897.1 LysR family transcriptional regulator [Pararhodobacter zhoushanensis]